MCSEREIDVYIKHVMSNIDQDVISGLNLLQIWAIELAIGCNAPFRRHAIDLRGTLRLHFAQCYFVVLIGRDRRSDIRNREGDRRRQAGAISFFLMLYTVIAMLLPVLLVMFYALKSWAGIDIFPSQHRSDLLSF